MPTAPPAGRRPRPAPGSRWERSRRARGRRWLAAFLVGVAVTTALSILRPRPVAEPGLATVVATRAIAPGAEITAADVRLEPRPQRQRPASAFTEVEPLVGRRVAGPVEVGGIVTTERLLGAGLLAHRSDGRVAMTVPVMEVALTGVQAGNRVDLYATGTGAQVVTGAPVLAVVGGAANPAAPLDGAADAGGTSTQGAFSAGALPWADEGTPAITLALVPSEVSRVAQALSGLTGAESFVLAVRPAS